MSNLIIACGIQKAYLHPGGSKYIGNKVSDTLDARLKSFFKSINKENNTVFLVREVHQPDDKFFCNKKTQSIVGSLDVQIPEFFLSYSKFIINTIRYNTLYKTPLESEIYKIKPEKIILVGFETHTMVLFTAEELRNRDYNVVVIEPLIAAEDDYLHAVGMTIMRNFLSVEQG